MENLEQATSFLVELSICLTSSSSSLSSFFSYTDLRIHMTHLMKSLSESFSKNMLYSLTKCLVIVCKKHFKNKFCFNLKKIYIIFLQGQIKFANNSLLMANVLFYTHLIDLPFVLKFTCIHIYKIFNGVLFCYCFYSWKYTFILMSLVS